MKKAFVFILFNFLSISNYAQESFFYQFNLKSYDKALVKKVIVDYEIAGVKYKDSLMINAEGTTPIKKLVQPVAAIIKTDNKLIKAATVMLTNQMVVLSIIENQIIVGKSKLQDDFLYLTQNDRIRPNYFPLYGELNAKNDTIGLKKLGVIFDSLRFDDIKKSREYFLANTKSPLSLFAFNRFTTFFAEYDKVESDYKLLPTWAKNSVDGQIILQKIDGAKSAQINTIAKSFKQKTDKGQEFNSEEFKGKYVLLDFWASWCAPCRKEHPKLIELYKQYKAKNFEIVSVSLDAEKSAWLNAIVKDKINWTQISDLKGQQNEIAVAYGVQSIPTNFLIDTQGKIIAKNLNGDQLKEKLKLLFTE